MLCIYIYIHVYQNLYYVMLHCIILYYNYIILYYIISYHIILCIDICCIYVYIEMCLLLPPSPQLLIWASHHAEALHHSLVVALQRVHGHLFSLGPGHPHGFGALVMPWPWISLVKNVNYKYGLIDISMDL